MKKHEVGNADEDEETLDIFSEYYRPFELTLFDTAYPREMPKSCRSVQGCICPAFEHARNLSYRAIKSPLMELSKQGAINFMFFCQVLV